MLEEGIVALLRVSAVSKFLETCRAECLNFNPATEAAGLST